MEDLENELKELAKLKLLKTAAMLTQEQGELLAGAVKDLMAGKTKAELTQAALEAYTQARDIGLFRAVVICDALGVQLGSELQDLLSLRPETKYVM